jgi:Zn-dependent protease
MKLFGIPIRIDFSFFVLVVILSSSRLSKPSLLISWIAVVFVSILIHEFGHALVGRVFGLEPNILLYSMGGLTSWTNAQQQLSPLKEVLISLAGPFAGFLFGGIVFLARPIFTAQDSQILEVIHFDLLWVNIGWGVFNLLPVLPLDGGNVLASIERGVLQRNFTFFSHVISIIIAGSLCIWAISIKFFWIALLGGWFAIDNAKILWQRRQAKLNVD